MTSTRITTFCQQHNLTVEQFYGREKIEGSLDLESLTSIPDGFNPTVGGGLYLRSLTAIPDGFNPTVGGDLYLPANLKATKKSPIFPLTWQDGKYIQTDGILTEVINHAGNVYRVKVVGKKDVTYLVTDRNGKWSHGETLEKAREDLVYKLSNRNTDSFKDLTLDSVLTFEEAAECYRVITGACGAGVKQFVESKGIQKEDITVRKIVEITNGHYGHEKFVAFFKK